MSLEPGAEHHITDEDAIPQDENRERSGSRVRFDLSTSDNRNSKSFRHIANLYDSVAGMFLEKTRHLATPSDNFRPRQQ